MSESNHSDWATYLLGSIAEPRRGITYSSAMLASEQERTAVHQHEIISEGGGLTRMALRDTLVSTH